MKVKCINNSYEGYELRFSIGKVYSVLAVEIYFNSDVITKTFGEMVRYRIVDDQEMVVPADGDLFTIVCERIPSNWVVFSPNTSSIEFLPQVWAYNSFWDDYYNDEISALEAFRKGVEISK